MLRLASHAQERTCHLTVSPVRTLCSLCSRWRRKGQPCPDRTNTRLRVRDGAARLATKQEDSTLRALRSEREQERAACEPYYSRKLRPRPFLRGARTLSV